MYLIQLFCISLINCATDNTLKELTDLCFHSDLLYLTFHALLLQFNVENTITVMGTYGTKR